MLVFLNFLCISTARFATLAKFYFNAMTAPIFCFV